MLKISYLGDSIFSFKGHVAEGNYGYYPQLNMVQKVEDMQFYRLSQKYGKTLVNQSWGGSRITSTRTDITHSILRAEKLHVGDEKPDVIVIAQGINDYFGIKAVVESDLIPNENPMRCFSYAYKKLIEKCQELYPEARILMCSLRRFNTKSVNEKIAIPNQHGHFPHQYNEIIQDVAEQYGCVYVDLWNLGINDKNIPKYYGGNDVHPGLLAMTLEYNALCKALNWD